MSGLDRGQALRSRLSFDGESRHDGDVEAYPWQQTHVVAAAQHRPGAGPRAVDHEEHRSLLRVWVVLAAGEVLGVWARVEQATVVEGIVDQPVHALVPTEVDADVHFRARKGEVGDASRPDSGPLVFHGVGQEDEASAGRQRCDACAEAGGLGPAAVMTPGAAGAEHVRCGKVELETIAPGGCPFFSDTVQHPRLNPPARQR